MVERLLDQQRQMLREQDARLESKLAEQRAELTAPALAAISAEQLAALQARLEGLHAVKLLADEEIFVLQDLVADFVELGMSMPGQVITEQMAHSGVASYGVAGQLHKLAGLSAAMAGDAAFARQVRRKHL